MLFYENLQAYIFDILIVGLPFSVRLPAVDSVLAVADFHALALVPAVSGTHAVAGVSSISYRLNISFPGFVWMAERLNIPF